MVQINFVPVCLCVCVDAWACFVFPCFWVFHLLVYVYVYPYIAAYKARFLIFENIWNANDADRIIFFSRVGLENGLDRENPYCVRIWRSSCSIIIGIAVTNGQTRLN